MQVSRKAYDLIKECEGFRSSPYQCSAKVWTIGYGTTIYPDGHKVSEQDPNISTGQAEKFLKHYVERNIEPMLARSIGPVTNQNQFDAVASFCYNVGGHNTSTSTLLKLIQSGQHAEAAKEFDKWIFVKGKKNKGLINRRVKERALFELDPYNEG